MLIFALVAHADDGKSYPGSMCQSFIPMAQSTGSRWNYTSGWAQYECPVLMDELMTYYPGMSGTLDLAESAVWVVDMANNGGVACTLTSGYYNEYGQYYYWAATTVYPGSAGDPVTFTSSSPQKLAFTGYAGAVVPTSFPTWYHLSCVVPGFGAGASAVVSYLIDENN